MIEERSIGFEKIITDSAVLTGVKCWAELEQLSGGLWRRREMPKIEAWLPTDFFQRGDAVPLTAAYCLSSKEKKEKYTELLDIAKGM